MIDLQVLTDPKKYSVDENKITDMAKSLLTFLGLEDFELSILIVDDEKIKELNKLYREKDKETDVLSFPQNDFDPPLRKENQEKVLEEFNLPPLLGDIIISLDSTWKNALSIGHSPCRELAFLLIHGLLHLCGHDHMEADEEKIMLSEQKILLKHLESLTDKETKPIWNNCVSLKKEQ